MDGDGVVLGLEGATGTERWRNQVPVGNGNPSLYGDGGGQLVLTVNFKVHILNPDTGAVLATSTQDDEVRGVLFGEGCFVVLLASNTQVSLSSLGARRSCPNPVPAPEKWYSRWTEVVADKVDYSLAKLGSGTPRLELSATRGKKELWRTPVSGTDGRLSVGSPWIVVVAHTRGAESPSVDLTVLDRQQGVLTSQARRGVPYVGPSPAVVTIDNQAWVLLGGRVQFYSLPDLKPGWAYGRWL